MQRMQRSLGQGKVKPLLIAFTSGTSTRTTGRCRRLCECCECAARTKTKIQLNSLNHHAQHIVPCRSQRVKPVVIVSRDCLLIRYGLFKQPIHSGFAAMTRDFCAFLQAQGSARE